ncbi:MAG: 2-C-methyl-D-erythritol 2,4-cyclodiphosphate synthase [Anaerovoracaceae bacterium]|nr:2-C-methyl-D-erythritol 2,4-cyclodiphosphate synthase [Anaerovoracaceae bacterium]
MYDDKRLAVIVAAAGRGSRLGGSVPKQFLSLGGEPILVKTLRIFEAMDEIDDIFIVTGNEYIDRCSSLAEEYSIGKVRAVVAGGAERQDSVYNGLTEVKKRCPDTEYVLIHDGARPFAGREVVGRVIEAAAKHGAAVACVPVKDSIRQAEGSAAGGKTPEAHESSGSPAESRAMDRSRLFAVQTPQGFGFTELLHAYEKAYAEGFCGTDDASVAELYGMKIAMVAGDYSNIKITTREDLPMENRVGTGFDVHKFEEGRRLILGGVDIPYDMGLAGHSDADVLIHALMDAMLGAAALGDIGRHFPDTDERYRGISSMKLLEHVASLLAEEGYSIGNVDVTVIAQAPKIAPHIEEMRDNIAHILRLEKNRINIKGTTTERLGFVGRKEGIAAEAVCSIYR